MHPKPVELEKLGKQSKLETQYERSASSNQAIMSTQWKNLLENDKLFLKFCLFTSTTLYS